MGENSDSFFDKILLKTIDEEIPIDVNILDPSAKNSPSTTEANSFSAQTKESELLQSLKNQISSFKNEITFLREEIKEKDYVIRTLLNMKCKFIHDCTSTSCNNLPSAISPQKYGIEIRDTPAGNTPKETIVEPKNAVHGSYNNSNLGKDKSSIDITRTNPKENKEYNTANREEEKNEKKQKKVQDREERPKIIIPNHLIPTLI